jgi:hypothetical protein
MEDLYEITPQQYEQRMFWKNVKAKCFQGFTSVHWDTTERQWQPSLCKFHTYQGLLGAAVKNIEEADFIEEMKRKPGEEEPERYLFVVDALLRHQEFTIEEVKFLRQINLEGFIIRITWGVLHHALIREALANLQEETMLTTVREKAIPLIAADWRTQFRDIFELTKRKVKASTQWKLCDLFPSLKSATEGQVTVKVSDCEYPGAKKPLRMLSSLFCLNTVGQNYIAITFAKLILAAVNGQAVDWPEEFYHGLKAELIKLHKKHAQTPVKVERTTIGPHLTLMIKAAGAMDLPHEIEAGFHTAKPFSTTEPKDQPKKRRFTTVPVPPPTLHTTVRVVKPDQNQQKEASTSAPPTASETPRSVVLETEEPWQVPEAIPNIVSQVKQVHRRLENLLTILANKAPPRLLRELGSQFSKVQREATLQEHAKHPDSSTSTLNSDILRSQNAQVVRLEKKLLDAEELNNLCIEDTFELHDKLSELQEENERLKKLQEENERLKKEGQALTSREQENMTRIQELQKANSDQIKAQEEELAAMRIQLQKLREETSTHDAYEGPTAESPRTQQHQDRKDLTRLQAENRELRAAMAARKPIPAFPPEPECSQHWQRPLDRAERKVLAEGAADQLISDLQHELQVIKQEKEELQHQLQQGVPAGHLGLPQSYIYPKSEVYQRLLNHTEPLRSVMQCHQAYGALNLVTSNLPILKGGTKLDQEQFGELWRQANARAKDTLAFMWAVGDIKLPLGSIEVITGSPPFFIRRYILRNIAFLAQHHINHAKGNSLIHKLPSLRPYTHSQKGEIIKLQQRNKETFQQAIEALRGEDTSVCFEAVRRHQYLMEHHPNRSTPVALFQLKEYVTQTLDDQQSAITTRRFGTINHGTILRIGVPDRPEHFHPDI